ncbi:N-hydroxyarylamine O-acetyltransferase [Paenibacillus forsythiae]|uniref:N-hydroxyarylamine O-acetyltransferase n=1 Tax=Paenibacillus forsythiae TaxID=365616 RepID=A0ABU3HFK8_9BACL|nr:arylamine N-acetyltransferase [Paenibacillus forsythiae]MDT3428837.1 N-hydroxyarylamine O-acetyltransferase [Paenibacillus forsythiae]
MQEDVFVHQYLERLKLHDHLQPDLTTLRMIQKQHLLNIPFENLDIMADQKIEFAVEKLWMKIVEHKRGGICYELNGLLLHLLRHIGFDVKYIAAQVLADGNEFDHVLLLVLVNGERWLVDAGFGDHFLEPVKLAPGTVQTDLNGDFKIVESGKGRYQLLKSAKGSAYSLEYTFTLQERKLEDFMERCLYFETSPDSRFRNNRLCSLERENGRVSLKDDKLILTEDGIRTEQSIETEQEFLSSLRNVFGIALKGEDFP